MPQVTLKYLFSDIAETIDDTFNSLKQRLTYQKNPIITHLNIDSFKNNFIDFEELKQHEAPLFLISKSKLANAFRNAQFQAEVYGLFCKDRNKFEGGIILKRKYFRKNN